MADNTSITAATGVENVATDELDTLNGQAQSAPKPVAQRVKIVHGADGDGTDVSAASPMPVERWEDGDFGYDAGSGDATVDVPANARVTRVSVVGHVTTPTTVTIAAGDTITIPAGGYFDEKITGKATLGGDVAIGGGDCQSYYVAWVVDA